MPLRKLVLTSLLVPTLATLAFASATPVIYDVGAILAECSAAIFDFKRSALWSLSDSGPGRRTALGFTDAASGDTYTIQIEGVQNLDWEALAQDQRGRLWILDVGNFRGRRPHVTLYQVDPNDDPSFMTSRSLPVAREITVTYEDGPRDVEAAWLVHERLYLIEKTFTGRPRLASVDVSDGSPKEQIALREGTLPYALGGITDASVSPDGTLFLLTYIGIARCDYCLEPDESRRELHRVQYGFEGQIESLIALSDSRFLVAGEDGLFQLW